MKRHFPRLASTLPTVLAFAGVAFAATIALGQPGSPSPNQPAKPGAAAPDPAAAEQPADKIGAALAQAVERYETSMSGLRKEIEAAMQRELDKAPASKQPEQAVQDARAVIKTFERSGQLPKLAASETWQQNYAKAAAELRKAYATASAAYTKAKLTALADAVDAEAAWVTSGWDLTPWTVALDAANRDEAARTITPASPKLGVATDVKGEYRLEIVAKRKDGTGALTVVLPLADGSRVEVAAPAGDAGSVRVLLTISKNSMSGQLGTARPIQSTPSAAGKGIELRSATGTFIVESVRVKALTPGAPPEVAEVVAPPNAKPPKRNDVREAPAAEVIPAKSKWRGTLNYKRGNDENIAWKVKRSIADELVIGGDTAWAGGIELTFKVEGNQIELKSVRPTGNKGGAFKDVSGSGKFANGVLFSTFEWRRDNKKIQGKPVEGSISLKKD